jgi:GxxExxY protein
LDYEFRAVGLPAMQQYGAEVHSKDILVGEYFVDLLVNDMLLVELTTVKALDDVHRMHQLSQVDPPATPFAAAIWQAASGDNCRI